MTTSDDIKNLTGAQKAAALLVLLGPEVSSNVIKKLNDDQIERISMEIVNMSGVSRELRQHVVSEFNETFASKRGLLSAGPGFAQNVLEKSIGQDKAAQIISRAGQVRTRAPFEFIKRTDPQQLMNFIQAEHPQTIAMVLSYLDPAQAAGLLSSLPAQQQSEVVRRIATMDKTTPEVIKEVEDVLERKLSTVLHEGFTATGGVKTVVEVLNRADRATEKNIFQSLEKDNPGLVEEIKKLMFVFEDIVLVDDRGIQQVLRDVDTKELAMALKTASDDVKNKIFKNMSKRAVDGIKEDMEFMGPVRLKQVEEAQQKVVAIVRKLEETGEIVIKGRGGTGDELVE